MADNRRTRTSGCNEERERDESQSWTDGRNQDEMAEGEVEERQRMDR
jgi:hypothetical protein